MVGSVVDMKPIENTLLPRKLERPGEKTGPSRFGTKQPSPGIRVMMSRSRRQRDKSMSEFSGNDPLSGKRFNTRIGNDFTGRRGMAHAVKGAKKFIRSRRRFHSKAALRKMEY